MFHFKPCSVKFSGGVKLRTKQRPWRPIRLVFQFFHAPGFAPARRSARAPDDANLRLLHPEPLPTGASNPIPYNPSEHQPRFPRPKRYALSTARSNARDTFDRNVSGACQFNQLTQTLITRTFSN